MTVRRFLQFSFGVFLAIEALRVFGFLEMPGIPGMLRDVGRNTGLGAFFGGLGAGIGAYFGGGSGDPPPKRGDPNTTRDHYDPATKKWTYRNETYYERFGDRMVQFSIWVQATVTAIVGADGKGSSGNACGKA